MLDFDSSAGNRFAGSNPAWDAMNKKDFFIWESFFIFIKEIKTIIWEE